MQKLTDMQALINVTRNAEGNQVVSARDLHTFLEIGRDFTNWCKKMFSYGFVENVDYAKTGESVNQYITKHDYILTLDTAKHISMIQRTEKGMQARQYFIECEKKLTQVKQVIQPAVENLQARVKTLEAKLLTQHQQHQHELKNLQFRLTSSQSQQEFFQKQCNEVFEQWRDAEDRYFKETDRVMDMLGELRELRKQVKMLPAEAPKAELPPLTIPTQINRLVHNYIAGTNHDYRAVYKWIYMEMADRYHVAPLKWKIPKGSSIINEVERRGYIDQMLKVAEHLLLEAQAA